MTRRELIGMGSVGIVAIAVASRFALMDKDAKADESGFPVTHSDAQWRAMLAPASYAVLRKAGTERPFSSPLLAEHRKGIFSCGGCRKALFDARTKFDSHTGWPSFWDVLPKATARREDRSLAMIRTEVHCAATDRRPADIRRRAAIAVGVAVLLCVGAAGVSVLAIYLPDRAADQTRSAVNAQGPKIVTEMLTYDPKSLKQDFERARSLTTDRYRPELVKQQESVQKGHPVINEYWVTDSTVLSAARDSATMLLFLQGQDRRAHV